MTRQEPECNPPIVICGMGRSGTTLIQFLVNTSANTTIFQEVKHEFLEGAVSILEAAGRVVSDPAEAWRGIEPSQTAEINGYIFYHLMRGLSRFSYDDTKKPSTIYGVKQPNAERVAGRLDEALGQLAPTYIYCFRDPLKVYESYLSMPWGDLPPNSYEGALRNSYRAAAELRTNASGRFFPLPIDTISYDAAFRKQVIRGVFSQVGIGISERTAKFIDEWPPVNRRDRIAQPPAVAPGEKKRRLEVVGQFLEHDEELNGIIEELRAAARVVGD